MHPRIAIVSATCGIKCNMKDTLSSSSTDCADNPNKPALDKAIFDQVVDRRHTGSLKWDKYADKDVLPMWVADMDFAVAEPIQSALIERLSHPVYGYSVQTDAFKQAIVEHVKREYNWTIDVDWLVFLPGVVTGLAVSCRAFCLDNDKIMVNPPIYHHFYDSHEGKRQSLVKVPLHKQNERWTYDLASMRKACADGLSMIMMCTPHNPTGTVFTQTELQQVGDMCAEHDMMIISDEIHCDLVIDKKSKHVPTAVACPQHADRIVTLMSASKTWNLAGLNASFAIISNTLAREKFVDACQSIVSSPPPLAMVATQAAYTFGAPWRQALLGYLWDNYKIIESELSTIRGLRLEPLQATYLAWVDATDLGLENTAAYFEQHGVGLSSGEQFGQAHYVRINFACPASVLREGLSRIRAAVEALPG